MTTNEKVARRKLSLLELAKELNNVSKACKLIGYSRQQFYEIRRNYQPYGAEGLLDKLPGWKGAHPWLITSCRSANNIMPITFFLPAFIASSFYSA